MDETKRQAERGFVQEPGDDLGRRTVLWLVAILLVGLGLRMAYLLWVTSNSQFEWIDPDSYMREARDLAGGREGWRWSFDAIRHSVEGRDYALPPLYPVFLSLFALFPSFPFNAQVGQVLLATLAIGAVFELGRQIHSSRTGLVAAAVYALWLPNIIAVWSTMQEALYIPLLLLAFILLTRTVGSNGGTLGLFSGTVFGLAALTRSMPAYFVVPAGLLVLATARDRKRALGPTAALLIGFALVTVPYSVALSLHLGEPTFIENHGGVRITARYGDPPGERPAGPLENAGALWRGFVHSPRTHLAEWVMTTRSLFHVNGGRLLQIYLAAPSYSGVVVWKILAHLGADLLFIVSFVLAPFGFILARRWPVAVVFAGWIALNVFLTALSGFGGARLRAPVEPHMIVLAGVVLAGHGERRSSGWFLLSGVLAAVAALTVLPQVPRSLEARGDYGVRWSSLSRPKTTSMRGRAGFNLMPLRETLSFDLMLLEPSPAGSITDIKVILNSRLVDETYLQGEERRFKYEWRQPELVFVELTATDRRTGEPERLTLRLGR